MERQESQHHTADNMSCSALRSLAVPSLHTIHKPLCAPLSNRAAGKGKRKASGAAEDADKDGKRARVEEAEDVVDLLDDSD